MTTRVSPPVVRREAVANSVAFLLLAGVAFAMLHWQADPWNWSDDTARWLAAVSVVVAYVAFSFALATGPRRRQPVAGLTGAEPAWPIVFASQTGYAEQIARRSADALRGAGAQAIGLESVDAGRLKRWTRALFVVSTTGEGDAPDAASGFVRDLLSADVPLPQLRYGILALGDRDYARYCAFGHRLDAWLRQQGAQPLFDLIEVDAGDDGALRHWQHHLGQLGGQSDLPDWQAPRYRPWRLVARRCLNPGSVGGAAFHLELRPDDPVELEWAAGDIAEIGPRHAAHDVVDFLAASGLDGQSRIGDDLAESLAQRLSRSRLPHPDIAIGCDPRELAASLTDLPHREYSVASIPADGALHLLVRQLRHPDGRLGLGAGWLTEYAPIGATVDLRIRANAGFRLPEDARPLILVGNGSGIAGLRALLRERIARGQHRNWLLFGERNADRDAFYGHEIAAALASSSLVRADFAWSREGTTRTYVQHRLGEAADEVRRWIADGASIYVCGSLEGMAPGVDATLREILGEAQVNALMDAGRYRRDVY
jgi:sulfite reductase (NADPH) flavoprotein alpha-component